MSEAREVKKGEKQKLQFCQYLYDDISKNMEEWISFIDYRDIDAAERTEVLTEKLAHLKRLLSEREEWFGADRCFL